MFLYNLAFKPSGHSDTVPDYGSGTNYPSTINLKVYT